jgi:predicted ATPase with chaperone activity
VISRVYSFVLQGIDAVRCEIEEGPVYDLPIAVAVLLAGGVIVESAGAEGIKIGSFLLAGELALDGRVRPIRGIVSLAHLARELGTTWPGNSGCGG